MTVTYPRNGFDCYGPVSASVLSKVVAAGLSFVGGYLWTSGKGMTQNSVKALAANGIRCLSYYEGAGNKLTSFSTFSGAVDARRAADFATEIGQPLHSQIFFAVDFDPTEQQVKDAIIPYFAAANDQLDGNYGVSGYGSGLVLSMLLEQELIQYTVLGGAMSWRGSRDFLARATVVQEPPSNAYNLGIQVDKLLARQDIEAFTWKWGEAIDKPAPVTSKPVVVDKTSLATRDMSPKCAPGFDLLTVQALLGVAADGVWGPKTEAAAAAYRQRMGYAASSPLRLVLQGDEK